MDVHGRDASEVTDLHARLQQALGTAYTLERELGGGGMARVFVATEAALGRRVVVKVLPHELAGVISVERFRREVQLAARLQHPHVVPLLSAGEGAGLLHYTMPYVAGETLRARLTREGALPVPVALRLARDVARALAHAHRHGVVHRDVKPENVLLGEDGDALVTDFGIAKALAAATSDGSAAGALTSAGIALGTPAYMAPEQALGDPAADHRADLYALGVLAYEALAGSHPFPGRSAQALVAAHATEAPEPLVHRRPGVPAPLSTLVMQLLEKHPADRPQSAEEVLRVLDATSTPAAGTPTPGEGSGGATPGGGARTPTARGRRVRLAAAAWLAAAALGAAISLAVLRRGPAHTADAGIVAVLPFRVAAADPSLRYLREGMLDLLAAKLAERPRALDPRAVLAVWRRAGGDERADVEPERALALATELGAGRLLTGEVVGSAARLVLSARLVEAPSGRERARASATGQVGDLAALVDSLAARLLALDAGEGATGASTLGGAPLPALQAYLAGQVALRDGEYQRAVDAYARALELDSTFVLAAVRLSAAADWVFDPRGEPARAFAMRNRARLGARDRWLLPEADERGAPITVEASIARLERAVSAVPDVPELWYALGDEYFHRGPLLGQPDVDRRATRAFERALALDSAFRPAFDHLPVLYAALGDTAGVRRSEAHLARDTTGDFWPVTKFLNAPDAAGRRDAMEQLLQGPLTVALVPVMVSPELSPWTPETGELLHQIWERAVAPADQQAAAVARYFAAMNRGQPTRADRAYSPAVGAAFPATALDAAFWDGDAAAATPRVAALARTAAMRPPSDSGDTRDRWVEATFLVAQEALARRDTTRAREAVHRLLSLPAVAASPLRTETPRWYALLLDAQLAAVARRADAGARLASLDSLLRLGPAGNTIRAVGNLVAARLWEERGDLPRAHGALLRTARGPAPTLFASTYLRERARMAAALGDREAAIRDFRRYLSARNEAEPALARHLASVRAELARLERASSGR